MSDNTIYQNWTNDRSGRFGSAYAMRPGPDGYLHQFAPESAVLAQAMREAGANAPYFLMQSLNRNEHPTLVPDHVSVTLVDGNRYEWPAEAVGPVGSEDELEAFWAAMKGSLMVQNILIHFKANHPNGVVGNHYLPVSYWATGDWDTITMLHTNRWNGDNIDEFTDVLCEAFTVSRMDDRRKRDMKDAIQVYLTHHLKGYDEAARLALSKTLRDFEHTYLFKDGPQTVSNGRFALTLAPIAQD